MWKRQKVQHPDWWGKAPEPIPWTYVMDPIPEPWRDHVEGKDAFLVRLRHLHLIAQPDRMAQVGKDAERLEWVRSTMAREGLHRPLQVCVDNYGLIVLADGHHRLTVAGEIGMTELPVFIVLSERSHAGCHVRDVLPALLAVR